MQFRLKVYTGPVPASHPGNQNKQILGGTNKRCGAVHRPGQEIKNYKKLISGLPKNLIFKMGIVL